MALATPRRPLGDPSLLHAVAFIGSRSGEHTIQYEGHTYMAESCSALSIKK